MTLDDEEPEDKESPLGPAKCGRDANLEAQANAWLAASAGENKRSRERDVEKMAFENGHLSRDELQYYDPVGDWKTQDSVFSLPANPNEIDWVDSTICVDVEDGNIRARNPRLLERQGLMRHVGDTDRWGSAEEEDIPILGSEGRRKVCGRCQRSKRVEVFSPKSDSRDGLHPYCKMCRREIVSQSRRGDSSK